MVGSKSCAHAFAIVVSHIILQAGQRARLSVCVWRKRQSGTVSKYIRKAYRVTVQSTERTN